MSRRQGPMAIIASLLIASWCLIPPSRILADEKSERKQTVNKLVDQLADTDAEKQAAAAAALLKLGPDILEVLPADTAKLTDAQKKHLHSIRASLREAQSLRDLTPRTVTFKENGITLSAALTQIEKQTGIPVPDRRQNKDSDPVLNLDLAKVTFWEAVDEIATKADCRVSLYEKDGVVALVDGPHITLPICYSGVFRIAVKRLIAVRDLEAEGHTWMLGLEIAWEPRFHPLFMETQPDALEVRDGKGTTLKNMPSGSGRAAVARPVAVETQLRVEAPAQPSEKIQLLKGAFTMIGPSRMLDFTFDKLTTIDRQKPEQTLKQSRDGVTVNIRELKTESDLWTVSMLLEYPADGPDFESFESWLVNNEIFLVKRDGKQRIGANGGYDIDDQTGHRAILNYRFIEDNTVTLGKPADWKLVYRTPGAILKMPVKFEFKDLPTP